MPTELTEEEMRRALFGGAQASAPVEVHAQTVSYGIPNLAKVVPIQEHPKRKVPRALPPKLRVTLTVGNEFEGERKTFTHDVDTLSTLLAEQEAIKAAKKKFRYVETISVEPLT
ncbi:hypothetical protein PMI26_05684 [Pseudomonas sp. GM33]|uniref:hypothetical protein n=1 Tax=Pseudomonas sp. GM33 TaxID=1144329 RepID=UPI00026FF1DF|nr:hypothetical protein [Pseudomonas sp. GM33]EJM34477.1 hypothetical protein PMI26_05684 [Pseudomonas sp. GM33]